MQDMLQQVQSQGIVAKCRLCGALNPNSQKPECWNCHKDGLSCPNHECGGLILRYDIEGNFWRCPNAAHGAKLAFVPREPREEWTKEEEEKWQEKYGKIWEEFQRGRKSKQEEEKNRQNREKDEKYPEGRPVTVEMFATTQCSWCRNFYTRPFLCPSRRLQSNCLSFDKLTEEQRKGLLGDPKWWWQMSEMLQQVPRKGLMARCRKCNALNPNPQIAVCWNDQSSLACPFHENEQQILRYDMENGTWRCPVAGCPFNTLQLSEKPGVKVELGEDRDRDVILSPNPTTKVRTLAMWVTFGVVGIIIAIVLATYFLSH
jgi:ribosomal protein L40E